MCVIQTIFFALLPYALCSLASVLPQSTGRSTFDFRPTPPQTTLTNAPIGLDPSGGIKWIASSLATNVVTAPQSLGGLSSPLYAMPNQTWRTVALAASVISDGIKGNTSSLASGVSSNSDSTLKPNVAPITIAEALSSDEATGTTETSTSTVPSQKPTIGNALNINAPPFNLNNNTCDDMAGDGAEQWSTVDGDKAVEKFLQLLDDDLLICDDCYGLAKANCTSEAKACGHGLRNLSIPVGGTRPRWDSAAGHFAGAAGLGDLYCGIQQGPCSSAPDCKTCNGPGSYAILKSLEVLHVALYNTYDAIQTAGQHCTDQMSAFSSTFAPIPDIKDKALFLGISTAIVGGMFGFIPGVGGALTGMLAGVGTSVAMDEFYMNQPGPADSASVLGQISNSTAQQVIQLTEALFENGSYTYSSADGSKTQVQTLQQMMKAGALMAETASENDRFLSLVPAFEKIMYQQLAVFTWKNMQKDNNKHVPFITFTSGPCDKVDSNMAAFDPAKGGILQGVPSMKTGITYNDTCWWLLDGTQITHEQTCRGGCGPMHFCEARALPGGTTEDMEKNKNIFSGLALEDFIIPSIEGWAKHDKKNDYPSASDNGQLVSSAQSAGAVNIPVCDYLGNKNSPGANCPKLRDQIKATSNGCDTHARNEENNAPGATASGSCRVHVTQFQKNEGDQNIFDQYQLKLALFDDADRMIGESGKQLASQPLELQSSLPFDLIAGVGSIDKDAIEFWYADQYWNSNDQGTNHQCKVGGYDSGVREMDCHFLCPAEQPSYDQTQSATATHHLSTAAVSAIGGESTFLNTYSQPSQSTSTSSATPTALPDNISHGYCRVHIRQHQKNEPDNPTENYELEVTIFDNSDHGGKPVSQSGMVSAPAGQDIAVNGLVVPLGVITGQVDKDPIKFQLKTLLWDSTVPQSLGWIVACSVGRYDSGHRDMDCAMPCNPD